MYQFTYETEIGRVTIAEENGHITHLNVNEISVGEECETALIRQAYEQLLEYLDRKRECFDLPLAPKGTEFQKRVWKALCDVPYGQTRSYKEIAMAVGNEKASRAVGMANNKNPIFIVVP